MTSFMIALSLGTLTAAGLIAALAAHRVEARIRRDGPRPGSTVDALIGGPRRRSEPENDD